MAGRVLRDRQMGGDPARLVDLIARRPAAAAEVGDEDPTPPQAAEQGGQEGGQHEELMTVDDNFHDPIVKRAGAQEFFRLAREQGMRTMFDDGLRKAIQGATTIEELLRVTRLTPR